MDSDIRQAFNGLERLVKDNFTNLSNMIADVKKDVATLQTSDRDMYKELIEVKAKAHSTQAELSEFKQAEKEYGKKTDTQLRRLDGLHWKILGVGIALISMFITAYKLFLTVAPAIK